MGAGRAVRDALRHRIGFGPHDIRAEPPPTPLEFERRPPRDSYHVLRLEPRGIAPKVPVPGSRHRPTVPVADGFLARDVPELKLSPMSSHTVPSGRRTRRTSSNTSAKCEMNSSGVGSSPSCPSQPPHREQLPGRGELDGSGGVSRLERIGVLNVVRRSPPSRGLDAPFVRAGGVSAPEDGEGSRSRGVPSTAERSRRTESSPAGAPSERRERDLERGAG